jgi:putative FmdB family regulatory protein
MPIYEYRCTDCGHEAEFLQKISEPPLTTCPACGKETLRKLVSAAGFQLKGSGWYVTDFKGNAKKSDKKPADKPADSKTETKTETKSDTKTDGKKDTKSEAAVD